ncbi:MAG: tetratricopeptide repeat protein [Acidobacteriota bacterium]
MASRTQTLLISTVIFFVGFTAVVSLTKYLEHNRIGLPESYVDEDLDLQGKKLNGFALGAEGLIADVYWIRALQYVGDKVINADSRSLNIENLQSLNPRLLYPLLDNATDLDPKFSAVFSYGATVLPAINMHEAVALTEKGILHNPDEWRLYQYLGYIYWRSQDYEKAGEVYERGSRIIGAPAFMRLMAARMRTDGGARNTAREIYSQMLDQDGDDQTREIARQRLFEIESLDELDSINSVLKSFQSRNGRCPANLAEILPQLKQLTTQSRQFFHTDNNGRFLDRSGSPYVLVSETCSVTATKNSTQSPLE